MKKTTTIVEENGKTTTTTVVEHAGKKPLHAQILIDNSGSMQGWETKVVSGVNEYAQSLATAAKAEGTDVTLSVTFFSHNWGGVSFSNIRDNVKIDKFVPLSRSEVSPNGGTPLYDAIGETINGRMKHLKSDETNVALVILTDGEENQSRNYTSPTISALLKKKQEENWVVLYLGANQDAWAVGDQMGTSRGLTAGYSMNNMQDAFVAASASSMRYMATGSVTAATLTDAERASMTKGDGGTVLKTP